MDKEYQEAQEKSEGEFQNTLFAHGVMTQNPELYWQLFPVDGALSPEEEEEVEWQRPQTIMDAEQMLAELRATGWGQGEVHQDAI